jgi:hypothetical protein
VRIRFLAPVLVAAALVFAAPSVASAAQKTETASSGAVQATLTYDVGKGIFNVTGTHLTITRSGATLLSTDVPSPCNDCGIVPTGSLGPGAKSLQVRDLDGDGEPEVLLDLYSGGAHCCTSTWIYRFTGTTYVGTPMDWGDWSYTLKDLNHDGKPELLTKDDRFAYVFTAYAEDWFPPRVFDYKAGKLTDVTRRFPALARADAKRALRIYHSKHRNQLDLRGVVAAYVADQYLVGHGSRGWKLVSSARKHGLLKGLGKGDPWPRGARFAPALRKFLRHNGYIRR